MKQIMRRRGARGAALRLKHLSEESHSVYRVAVFQAKVYVHLLRY